MQRVIIDTNVIVSSLIQRSYPYKIIYNHFVNDRFSLCISDELLKEYFEVLGRVKFKRFPDFAVRAERLLAEIESKSQYYKPKTTIEFLLDKADNKLLELATECSADCIITGNTNDFSIKNFNNTIILTPKEYWERYEK